MGSWTEEVTRMNTRALHPAKWAALGCFFLSIVACPAMDQNGLSGLRDYALVADESIGSLVQGLSGEVPENTVLIATANLNLRTEPSTDSTILRTMAMNSAMTVVGQQPTAGFYRVRHGNLVGWAHGSYMEEAHAPISETMAVERLAAAELARSAIGFSYWWGHARWTPNGATGRNTGACSRVDGTYFHEGDYGADCSGLISKAWQVPADNLSPMSDVHGPGTARYAEDQAGLWHTIPLEDATLADAMVRRKNGAGHIFLVVNTYDDGVVTYECRGCEYGCVSVKRPWTEIIQEGYHAIRRDTFL